MIGSFAESSPRLTARLAGAFQLAEALAFTFGYLFILGNYLTVSGDAAATAANILGQERLFWLGFVLTILAVVFHIAWALLMYELLKPVNRSLSRFSACIMLIGCAIQAVMCVFYLAPLPLLHGGSALAALTPAQLQALAYMFLKLNTYAFDVYLVFFGLWCILTGYLIFKSAFLPRVLGVLLMISGLGWVIHLFPPIANRLFPIIAGASALGEIPLEFWLIVMAVNAQRWKEQASR
jgi:Domain of unknown function (DUF4386)